MCRIGIGCAKQVKGVLLASALALLAYGSACATSYFVSPTGNDALDGLTPANAWISLDRGDQLGVLTAGDVVNVFPGTYLYSRSMTLTKSGTTGSPIVYRILGVGQAVIDGGNADIDAVVLSGKHVIIDGLTISRVLRNGLRMNADSCTVQNCRIYDVQQDGIRVDSVACTIMASVISNTTGHGIQFRSQSDSGRVYGNTIYQCTGNGVEIQSNSARVRIFNNIAAGNAYGIKGWATDICGFNDVWNNASGSYNGGVADSSGGLSVDPLFVNAGARDFRLQLGSPVIDKGLALGYSFEGVAPDMGACEFYPTDVEGIQLWRSGSSLWPKYRLWYGDSYGAAATADSIGVLRNIQGALSSRRDEGFIVAVDQDRQIGGEMWNGNSWTALAANDLATISTSDWHSCDVAYEHTSGHALMVWDNGTVGAASISHAVWNGTTWNSATSLAVPLVGEPLHLRLAPSPLSDEMVLAVSNSGSQDFLAVWSGSAWGHIQITSLTGLGDNLTDVAVAYEQQSGRALAVNGDNSGYLFYRIWNGAGWSVEDSLAPPVGVGGNVLRTTMCSDPSSNRIALGVLTTGSGVWFAVWNGTAWEAARKSANAASGTGYPAVAVAFAGSSGRAIGCYSATTSVCCLDWTSGGGWVESGSGIDVGAVPTSLTLTAQPGTDRVMLTVLDNAHDLNSVLWDGLGWAPIVELETAVGEATCQPFTFMWKSTVDQPPVLAAIGPRSTTEGVQLVIAVSATDAESTPVLTVPSRPIGASFSDRGDGTGELLWTPTTSQAGTYTVTFYATDDAAQIDSEVVTVTVYEATNHLPSITPLPLRVMAEGSTVDQTVAATDAESVPTLTSSSLPSGATFVDSGDGSGVFHWVPSYTQSGAYSIVFYATDDSSAVDSAVFSLTITEAGNRPPVLATIGSQSVVAWDSLTFTASASDAESTPALTSSMLPTGATYVDHHDGTAAFRWVPDGSQVGNRAITFYATDDSAAVDSEVVTISVTQPALDHIVATPDSAVVSADSTLTFSVVGYEHGGHEIDPGNLTWSVAGAIGTIDSLGEFDATTSGVGRIAVVSDLGPRDTTAYLRVVPGALATLEVTPDSVVVGLGDSVQFSAVGYDADGNVAGAGTVSWRTLGRVGRTDVSGLFVANRPGSGRVAAASNVGGITDTSALLEVEELYVSPVAIGTGAVRPGERQVLALALRVDNYFDAAKTLIGLTLRDASRGVGDAADLLTNVDSVFLYVDRDNDSLLSVSDSLIARAVYGSVTALPFTPLSVASDDGLTLLAAAKIALDARDGDSLDILLRPADDITTGDGTIAAGADTLNSLGYSVIDGLVAAQVTLVAVGGSSLETGDSLYHVLTVDLPRNGYSTDVLRGLSVVNQGTASSEDIDSLVLFRDLTDHLWTGSGSESRLGRLVFTGDRWSIGGLSVPLTDSLTRFYVAGSPSAYPINGRTLALGIPLDGIEMLSQNDGPVDSAIAAVDTFQIQSNERLLVQAVSLPVGTLVPGERSSAVLALSLINSYPGAVTVDSVRLALVLSDPDGATPQQLRSQVDSVLLYLNLDSDSTTVSTADSLLAAVQPHDDQVSLTTDGIEVAGSGGRATLLAILAMDPDSARNGNQVGASLNDASDLFVTPASAISGDFPMQSCGGSTIDAFPSTALAVMLTGTTILYGGQTKRPILDFRLPGNGYAADVLTSVRIHAETDLDAATLFTMKLWRNDDGHGSDTPANLLGQFAESGSDFSLDGLSAAVPAGGARFVATVDIADRQFNGGAVQFSIPQSGVTYESGADGPDDHAVASPETPLAFASDRITVISVPAGTTTAAPGTADQNLLTFALYNGYASGTYRLQSVNFTNISRTASSQAYVDGELGQVSLLFDEDNDRLPEGDPITATGYFAGGRLRLTGLDIALPAESLSYFFVLGNVAQHSIDSDSLAIAIAGVSDLTFNQTVTLNGDLPLISGGYVVVDGSVAEQYRIVPLQSRTLTPGDTSVPLLAFAPATNGDRSDILQSVRIVNAGDATPSDVTDLQLWLDSDGDESWQATDSLLGPLVYAGGGWTASGLDLNITVDPPVLFVIGDVDSAANSGAVFLAQIPVAACQFASGNDGPRDTAIASPTEFTISMSPLRVAQSIAAESYSVGQTIVVTLTATNLSATTLVGVSGEIVGTDNPAAAALDSSHAGPVALASGESEEFSFFYTAQSAGDVSWQVRAVASLAPDSSVTVHTRTIHVQTVPENAAVQLVGAIPTSVTRGLENVFPLSLTIIHPDTAHTAAALRLDSLRLDVLDESGTPLAASAAFSQMALSTGYMALTVVDDVPDQPQITFHFDAPLVIKPGFRQTIALLVDINPDATASSFALSIPDASAVTVADNNTLLPVTLDPAVSFPLKTESCRIDDPTDQLAVTATSLLGATANYGQRDVDALQLKLRHPGRQGSSQIQVSGVRFRCVDSAQEPIVIASLFDSIVIMRGQTALAVAGGSDVLSDEIALTLASPLVLNPGTQDSVRLVVSLLSTSASASFGVVIDDSTCLSVRDLSSGSPVVAATDTLSLATGSVFPIATGYAALRHAAVGPSLCCSDVGSGSVVGGADGVPLADLAFAYPVDSTYSAIHLSGVQMMIFDDFGSPLNADVLFDKLGVSISGETAVYQAAVEMTDGLVTVAFGPDGLTLGATDTVTVRIVGDIEGDVPYETFRLGIQSLSFISVRDATDSSHQLLAEAMEGCSSDLPFSTATTHILLPAGRPGLTTEQTAVQVVSAGQSGVTALQCELAYAGTSTRGDIALDSVTIQVLRRTVGTLTPVAASDVFDSVRLVFADSIVAEAVSLADDHTTLVPATAPTILNGETIVIGVVGDIKADAPLGNYIIRLQDSTSIGLSDASLATTVYAAVQGVSYPVAGTEISVVAAGLEQSFSSYPNPFSPSVGEEATIAYVLTEPAEVDIELFTLSGEAVAVIVSDAYRAAGSHQSDTWSGVNDAGLDVLPGTYFCRITARYVSGATETFRRKVTVIR